MPACPMKLAQKTIDGLAVPKGKSELIVFDDQLPGFGFPHHRLSSTEHSGVGGGPVAIHVFAGFKYDDDDGAATSARSPGSGAI